MNFRHCLAGALLAALSAGACAQRQVEVLPQPTGFLCCNMHTDGKWISDINYVENAPAIVPLGTPAQVTGYGRHRVQMLLGGKPQTLGNDYSRTLKPEDFAGKSGCIEFRASNFFRHSPTETEIHDQRRWMGLKDNQRGGSIHVARFKALLALSSTLFRKISAPSLRTAKCHFSKHF